MSAISVLIDYNVRDSIRNRWLQVYAVIFALLAGSVALGGSAAASFTGTGGFGPVVAQFVVLVMLLAPLMGLTLGVDAVVRDRERGIFAYVLAQPVSRAQYFVSKIVVLAIALCAAVLFGFGVAALFMGALGSIDALADLAVLLGLTWLLTVAMAAVGIVVSVTARKAPTALGIAIALWLAFTMLGDMGLMATALATRIGIGPLLYATLLNPVEAFRIAAIAQLSGSLDALGAGGRLASDVFGGWILPVTVAAILLWLFASIACAWLVFRRGDAV